MIRPIAALAAFGLAVSAAAAAAAAPADLVIRAGRAHLGDGRVIDDAVVVIDRGRIAHAGPAAGAPSRPGARTLTCDELLPGLVVETRPVEPDDAESVNPSRLALDLLGPLDGDALLDRGITTVAVSPGTSRLVSGRGALVRVRSGAGALVETVVREGAVHAGLTVGALEPPLLFEPVLRVNADNPLPPARPQRPWTPMAAVAELRRLVLAPGLPWIDVRAGRVPLRVRARREDEIRRALGLARDASLGLVIEGGDEAWKLADELAAAGCGVVLERARPGEAVAARLDVRADAAALLATAGVPVALTDPLTGRPDPLLLASAAVRAGLARDAAIAAVTGRLAHAAGGRADLLRAGETADLVAFAGDPLAAGARPSFVVAGGRLERESDFDAVRDARVPALLVVRAGRATWTGGTVEPASILIRGERIASVTPDGAAPSAARVIDLGPNAVAVPGFIDAFSRAGLEPGPPPGGSPRVRAADAIEPAHASIARALDAGLTSAVAVPATAGLVLGGASVIGLMPRRVTPPHDADRPAPAPGSGRPVVDVIAGDAGLVFWLDDGPADVTPRQAKLKALRDLLQRAKGYHDAWARTEKKPDDAKGKRPKKPAKPPEKPDKDPSLEPFRAAFAGRTRTWLRSGREDLLVGALDAFKAVGLTPVTCGGEEADLVASELATRGITVVLGPQPYRRDGERLVNVAAELRAQGVPVAFGSFGTGTAEDLPFAVAALVRAGLSPADALAGLTSTAAASCGQEAQLGKLDAGARADLVVFDGDPMEPSSRIRLVVARGRVAWPPELADEEAR